MANGWTQARGGGHGRGLEGGGHDARGAAPGRASRLAAPGRAQGSLRLPDAWSDARPGRFTNENRVRVAAGSLANARRHLRISGVTIL